jgi:WXG100 family type VII secretion target
MADNISTDTPGMQIARSEFESKTGQFVGELGVVNQEWLALQGLWTGTASRGYGQAMDAWETCFRNILECMGNMIESLGGSAQVFEQQEEINAAEAPAWATLLPGV